MISFNKGFVQSQRMIAMVTLSMQDTHDASHVGIGNTYTGKWKCTYILFYVCHLSFTVSPLILCSAYFFCSINSFH